jgi:hypothetical protein
MQQGDTQPCQLVKENPVTGFCRPDPDVFTGCLHDADFLLVMTLVFPSLVVQRFKVGRKRG